MKHKGLILLCTLLSSLSISAADNLRVASARALATGGNVATQSILFNPSLLAFNNEKVIHLQYANRYAMKELSSISVACYLPHPTLSWGIDVCSFGYDEYRESMFRLSLAKRLNRKWSLGIGLQYGLLQSVLSESNESCIAVDVGLTHRPIDRLLIGVLITNLPSIHLTKGAIGNEVFMSYSVQAGFQYTLLEGLYLMGNGSTMREQAFVGSVGLRYEIKEGFSVAAGIQGAPLQPSGGVTYRYKNFAVDAAVLYHTVLGVSTALGLSYRL